MLSLHTILHPTDFSPRSDYAFQLACSYAHDHGARLVVLHVAPSSPPEVVAYHGAGISPEQLDAHRKSLWSGLRRLRAPEPGVSVEYRLEEGDAAAAILRVAAELNCDLIVMGTHGRSGLSRLLVGSVAERVLRQATCPVLFAKPVPHDAAKQPELAATGA